MAPETPSTAAGSEPESDPRAPIWHSNHVSANLWVEVEA